MLHARGAGLAWYYCLPGLLSSLAARLRSLIALVYHASLSTPRPAEHTGVTALAVGDWSMVAVERLAAPRPVAPLPLPCHE